MQGQGAVIRVEQLFFDSVHYLWALSDQCLAQGKVIEAVRCLESIVQRGCATHHLHAGQQTQPLGETSAIAKGAVVDVEVKTRLRLADVLIRFTTNYHHAKAHLDRAVRLLAHYILLSSASPLLLALFRSLFFWHT